MYDQSNPSPKENALKKAVDRNTHHINAVTNPTGFFDSELKRIQESNQIAEDSYQRNSQAWANDTELDTLTGNIKQLAALGIKGTLDVFNDQYAGIDDIQADKNLANTSEEARGIYQRLRSREQLTNSIGEIRYLERNGQLTTDEANQRVIAIQAKRAGIPEVLPEEEAVLDQVANPENIYDRSTQREYLDRFYQNLDEAQETRQAFEDHTLSSISNPIRKNKPITELGALNTKNAPEWEAAINELFDGDTSEGILDLIQATGTAGKNIGQTAINNPLGTLDLMIEDLGPTIAATLLGGKKIGAAVNALGASGDALRAHNEGLRKFVEENNRLPTEEEHLSMVASAVAYAGSDFVADKLAVDKLIPQKTLDAAKASANKLTGSNRILQAAKRVGGAGKDITTATAAEFVAGGVQGLLEETTLKGNYDPSEIDSKAVLDNATTEALAGTGAGTLGSLKRILPNKNTDIDLTNESNNEKNSEKFSYTTKGVDDSIRSPKNKDLKTVSDYAREVSAVDTKTAQEYHAKASSLVAQNIKKLTGLDAELEALEDKGETGTRKYKKLSKELTQLEAEVDRDQQALRAIALRAYSDKDTKELVQTVTSAQEVSSDDVEKAVNQIVNLATISPDSLSPEDAQAVSQSGNTRPEQKEQLQAFAVAKQAVAAATSTKEEDKLTTQKVQKEVLFGGRAKKGLKQFRQEVVAALTSNNAEDALTAREALFRFASQHRLKADEFSRIAQPYRDDPSKKGFSTTNYTISQPRKEDGSTDFRISRASLPVVDAVQLEANALDAGLAEVDAMLRVANLTPLSDQFGSSQTQTTQQAQTPVQPQPAPTNTQTQSPERTAPTEVTPDVEPEIDIGAEIANLEEAQAFLAAEPPVSEGSSETNAATREVPQELQEESARVEEVTEAAGEVEQASQEPTQRQQIRTEIERLEGRIQQRQRLVKSKASLTQAAEDNNTTPERVKEAMELSLREDQSRLEAYQNQLDTLDGKRDGYSLSENLVSDTLEDEALERRVQASNATPESKAKHIHHTVNLVKKHFTAGRKSILNQVQNVIEAFRDDPEIALGYVEQKELTVRQKAIVQNFVEFHEFMVPAFEQLFKPKTKHRYDDYINYLVDTSTGYLDPNVSVAINASIYNWVITSANGTYLNDAEAINNLLGRDSKAKVSRDEKLLLSRAGISENEMARSLGREIRNSLGIRALDSAPGNEQQRLEASLGNHALAMMVEQGFLSYKEIPLTELDKLSGKTTPKEREHLSAGFYRARFEDSPTGEPQLHANARQIVELNKESGSFFNRLMNTSWASQRPTLKPSEEVDGKMRGTDQDVPEEIQEILREHQSRAHSISPDTDKVFSFLSPEQQEEAVGIDRNYKATRHVENHEEVEGKNDTLKREIDNYREWKQELIDRTGDMLRPFYMTHSVWKNLRIGMNGSVINPQASKVQRGLVRMNDWIQQIDKSNPKHVEQFRLGVAEALDLEADKKEIEPVLAHLEDVLGTDDAVNKKGTKHGVKTALEGIKALLSVGTELSEEDRARYEQHIVRAMKEYEGTHTLHGLVNLAKFELAPDDGSFESDLAREIDGVTNGPIIGTVQFAAQKSFGLLKRMLERGGVFFDGNRSLGKWFQAGNSDSYESLAKDWAGVVDNMLLEARNANRTDDAIKIELISKYFAPVRGNSKNPLMTTVYGSGETAQKKKLNETFMEAIYEKIEQIVAGDDSDQEKMDALDAIERDLNTIAGAPVFNFTGSIDSTLHTLPNPKGLTKLNGFIANTYGNAVLSAIDYQYGGFKQNRTKFNEAISAVTAIYKVMYDREVQKRTQEMIAAGELVAGFESLPETELAAIREHLQAVMPIVSTTFDQDNLNTGVFVSKEEKSTSYEAHHATRSSFGNKLNYIDENGQVVKSINSLESRGVKSEITDPGVAPAIIGIHSIDASIALMTMKAKKVLNVHDGFGAGILSSLGVGKALNQNFYQMMTQYSLPAEARKTMERTMEYINQLPQSERNTVIQEAEQTLLQWMPEYARKEHQVKAPGILMNERYNAIMTVGDRIPTFINKVMARATHILQYNIEEGGYTTGNQGVETAQDEIQPTQVQSRPNPIENFIRNSDQLTPRSLLDYLEKNMNAEGSYPRAMRALMKRLKTALPKDVQVKLYDKNSTDVVIDPTLPEDQQVNLLETEVRGLFDPNTNTVYLRSTDFKNHGMGIETVTHEMLHAVVSKLFQTKNKPVHVKQAIRDLNTLMDKTQQYIAANPGEFSNLAPFESLDEFVTWGMTNKAFQELLKKVQVERRAGQRIITGFKTLVDALHRALFGKSALGRSETMNTALYQLIENAGVLLAEGSPTENNQAYSVAPQRAENVDRMTSAQILSALGQIDERNPRSGQHTTHLASIQQRVIDVVAGPFNSRLKAAQEAVGDDTDQFIRNVAEDTTPFTSEMVLAFEMSHQEAYVAEQVEVVFGNSLDNQSDVTNELDRLWEVARKNLRPEDFYDMAQDAEQAQWQYDLLFNTEIEDTNSYYSEEAGKVVQRKTSAYLQRFTALALTNEAFRNKLSELDANIPAETLGGQTFGRKLEILLERVLNTLSRWVHPAERVKGDSVVERADNLLNHLAQIELRNKQRVLRAQELREHPVNQKLNDTLNGFKQKLDKLGQSDRLQNSRVETVGAVGTVISTVAGGRVEVMADMMKKVRDRIYGDRLGHLGELANEVRGATPVTRKFFNLLRFAKRDIDQQRAQVTDWVKDLVKGNFSQELTKEESEALTRAVLRTDMASLLDDYALTDLINFMGKDSKQLDTEIRDLRRQLSQFQHQHWYRNQSKALGYHMVKGRATSAMLMLNAHNIAFMGGTSVAVNPVEADQAMPIIDRLASLEAIKYSDQAQKDLAIEVFRREITSNDTENGATNLLQQAKLLKEQALSDVFAGDLVQFQKGYTFDITDPHQSVIMMTEAQANDEKLMEKGYIRYPNGVGKDPGDPDQDVVYIYHRRDGGNNSYLTGVISYTSKAMKGTSLASSLQQAGVEGAYFSRQKDMRQALQAKQPAIQNLLNRSDFDPEQVKTNHLVPVLNSRGDVHNLRYMMSDHIKDTVLNRHNDVSEVLGAQAGNIIDKGATKDSNDRTIDALKAMYDEDFLSNSEAYIKVGPDSTDPRLKEVWAMLPAEAKQRVEEVWGSTPDQKGLWVRNDILDLVFGYRKMSVSNVWNKEFDQRNVAEKAFTFATELMFKEKASSKVKAGEDIVQELIKEVKDILVIKNFFTLAGNIMSNLALLSWSGVPMKEIVKSHKEAYEGALRYQADQKELFQTRQKLNQGSLSSQTEKELKSKIARLEHRLSNNPVAELIEAGTFQTIIEDIDQHDDQFSFKSQLGEFSEKYTSKVPDSVKNSFKFLTLSHDTGAYKFLNQTTQLSDFVARYTKYKYLTQHPTKPVTKAEAIETIMDDFVHYDVPTSRTIQYLNDMGIMMFSKYYLRMQRPLLRLFRNNPARGLWLLAMQGIVDFSAPTDSVIWARSFLDWFSNPFSTMFGAPDEIIPVNATLHATGIK
ncbi:MAG: hypothetical protein ACRBB6_04175 [Neptuniibacter sp.]